MGDSHWYQWKCLGKRRASIETATIGESSRRRVMQSRRRRLSELGRAACQGRLPAYRSSSLRRKTPLWKLFPISDGYYKTPKLPATARFTKYAVREFYSRSAELPFDSVLSLFYSGFAPLPANLSLFYFRVLVFPPIYGYFLLQFYLYILQFTFLIY